MKKQIRLKDISLRIKIPVLICMVLTLLVSVSCLFLYRYYYSVYSSTVKKTMEGTVLLNKMEMSNLFQTIFTAIDVVNDNEEARRTNTENKLSNIAEQIVQYEHREDQSDLYENIRLLATNKKTFQDLFQVAMIQSDPNGEVYLLIEDEYPITHLLGKWKSFKDTEASINLLKSQMAEKLQWYQKAVELQGENYWFCEEEYPDCIFLAKQLHYKYMNRNREYSVRQLGVIVLKMNMQWLEERMRKAELTEETQIYLTDASGMILHMAGEAQLTKQTVSEYIIHENEQVQVKEMDHASYLVQKSDIGHGLYLMTVIPFYDIEQMAFQMVRVILIVMVVVLAFGIVLMTILSKWMLAPVMKLSGQMEKGVSGEIAADNLGNDEIGTLYRSYNRMQQKTQELLNAVWEQAEKRKNAEIHALQMQINPHFVFNTLGAISGLALLNGQDEIAEQLKLLSALMRYNTRNPDGLVALETEIEIIQKYEKIQHFSFDEKFSFHYDVMEKCKTIMIPKLIIQPLVENTIIHSRNKNGEGSVTITAKQKEKDCLLICVTDGGVGVDVEQINRYIKGENVFHTDKASFGIRNVYERIRLIYGENGNLEYRHNEQGNTEAVVTIWVTGTNLDQKEKRI